MTKTTYFFSHDTNARNDERIIELRSEFGWEGYGIYFALLEVMALASDFCLSLDRLKFHAFNLQCDKKTLQEIVRCCLDCGLFQEDQGQFYSPRLRDHMEQVLETREKRKKAAEMRWSNKSKQVQSTSNANAYAHASKNDANAMQSKGKESKVENKSTREQNDSSSLIRPEDVARILSAGGWAGVDAIGMNYAVCRAASELNLGPGQIIARAKAFAGYCKKADWNGQFKSSFAKWINDRSEGVALDWAAKLEADFKNDTEQIKLPSPWSRKKN